MGMFGGQAAAKAASNFDPSKLSTSDKWMLFGSALKDAGAGLAGRDSDSLMQVQGLMAARQQKAQHDAFLQKLTGMMAPTYADSGPSPTVTRPGLIGGQAAAGGMDDASGAIGGAASAMSPGPLPQAAAPYQYQPPQRTSDGLSINDPRMAAIALGAPEAGVNIKDLLDVMKAQQPDVMFDRGFGYNKKTGGAMGGFHPDLDKGQALGPNGSVINLPGALTAATDMAGGISQAQETAKAGLDLVDVPRPDGSMVKMTRLDASRLLSGQGGGGGQPQRGTAFGPGPGFGVSQAPGDKTYSDEGAKAASTAYQSMQSAALKAPGEIAKYQRLGELLNGYEGGKFSPALKNFSSAANSLGFSIDKNLPNKEAAAAITNQLALSLRDPSNGGGMPGAMSDADRAFLVQSVPGLVQTATGRKQMVEAQVKVLQRNQDVAAKARQWQQRFGRIDKPDATGKSFQDYLDGYTARHPLFAHQ